MFLKFAAKLRKKNDIHKSVWHILEFLYFFEPANSDTDVVLWLQYRGNKKYIFIRLICF
jgi:hypothetical protein